MDQQTINLQDGTQLDSKVVKVMKAIRQVESGGDFNAVGKAGEKGAYQWLGNNWNNAAKNVLGDVNAPMTPANQNKVAYSQIKAYKDAGHDPEEIAALWNGAHKDFSSGRYVYNNPAYGQKFREAITGQQHSNQPSGQSDLTQPKFFGDQPTNQNTQTPYTGTMGTNPNDSAFGKLTDNSITRGLIGAVPGASQLGGELGSVIAKGSEKIKGLLGGQDNSKYIPEPNVPEAAKGAVKVMGTAASLIPVASLMKGTTGILKGTSALNHPVAQAVLKTATVGGESIAKLPTATKVNVLTEALQTVTEPAEKAILTKALQEATAGLFKSEGIGSFAELNPIKAKALGLSATALKFLLRGAADVAGLGILSNFLK